MAHIWFIEYILQPAFNNKVSETLKWQIRIEKAVRSFSPGRLPRPSRRLCCIEGYHQVQPERMLVLYPCHVKHGYLRLLKPIQDHLSKSMPNFPFQSPRATGECTDIDTPVNASATHEFVTNTLSSAPANGHDVCRSCSPRDLIR